MFTAKHFWHYCPPSNPAKIWAIVETEPNNLPNPSPYSQQPQHVPTRPKTTPSPWLDQPTQTTLTLELGTTSLLSHQTLEETWYCGMRPNQSASRVYCARTYREPNFDPACWNKFLSKACNISEQKLPEHKDVDFNVTISMAEPNVSRECTLDSKFREGRA